MAFFQNKDMKRQGKNQNALKGGSYSLAVVAVVLAIVVVINLFASALPANLTKYDMSATQLYSITSNTKVVVNALEQDVNIYWITQAGEEDEIMTNLLEKYESLSDHIKVIKKNPDVFPTFAQQYTDEMVRNNSLVVECGERYRYIAFEDIYLQEMDMETGYSSVSFDGEGAITSAIDYVTTEDLPQMYVLEGHGEAEFPERFEEQIEKENIEVSTFSLLNVDAVPEEADCVMIYAPSSDISEEEAEMLNTYVEEGGKLFVAAGPTEEGSLDNLYSILEKHGVETADGIVVEGTREFYAFGQPHVLLAQMEYNEVTETLIEESYYPILPLSQGMIINDNSGAVQPILTTSDLAYSKIDGYALETYEWEEGDTYGPFAVGVSADAGTEGKIIWYSSSVFLDDMYNAFSSGANMNLAMNSLSSLLGEREAIAIRSKSLDYNYLTISESTASMLKTVMIGLIPILYLGIGIAVVLRRRRVQNEAS